MDENQKTDENTKRIVASNLTAAYFATNPQTAKANPIDRKHAMDEILAVYTDFLIRRGAA